MKVWKIGVLMTLMAVFIMSSPVAQAASYPDGPLSYIVCFNPGGESDITARIQEAPLKKYFGQDVVINYKIGGGGSVGW